MTSSHSVVTKNLKVEAAAAPPSPPPLPPARKAVGSSRKAGIGTLLGTESSKPASIRRTLSADFSSMKWLSKNVSAKKTASSDELTAATAAEDRNSVFSDIWSSILQTKKTGEDEESTPLPPPYIHPMIKKSSASLTGKSLEICTESLGSETGSDCFSSESGDSSADEIDQLWDNHTVVMTRKQPPQSLPPPLPSLVRGGSDQSSVRVKSCRKNGRLILEAVSVPSLNCFRANRKQGRLVLTFVGETEDSDTDKMPETEDSSSIKNNVNEEHDDDDDGDSSSVDDNVSEERENEDDGDKETEIICEKRSNLYINLNSFINKNRINRATINLNDNDNEEDENQITGSKLINTYEYFWRKKPTIATLVHIPTVTEQHQHFYNNNNDKIVRKTTCDHDHHHHDECEEERLVLIKARNKLCSSSNKNIILPMLKGCKEHRMSLLVWEPYCIATT